jgi:hypothetical protein
MEAETFVKMMVEGWSAPIVARTETRDFTGGGLSPRSVANLESAGEQIRGRFLIGRKICYPTENFARWIADRLLKEAQNIAKNDEHQTNKN